MKTYLILICFLLAAGLGASVPAPAGIETAFLALDNGGNQLARVERGEIVWQVPIPAGGRDLQRIGPERVLVSHAQGFQVRNLGDGSLVAEAPEVSRFKNVQSARQWSGGFIVGEGAGPAILVHWLSAEGEVCESKRFEGYKQLRLLRLTKAGHLLFTAADPYRVVELRSDGREVQSWPLRGKGYVAVPIGGGRIAATNGESCEVEIFDPGGERQQVIGGRESFPGLDWFSGMHAAEDGSFWVANWMGHLPAERRRGPHVLVYGANGEIEAACFSESLQQVTNLLPLAEK